MNNHDNNRTNLLSGIVGLNRLLLTFCIPYVQVASCQLHSSEQLLPQPISHIATLRYLSINQRHEIPRIAFLRSVVRNLYLFHELADFEL